MYNKALEDALVESKKNYDDIDWNKMYKEIEWIVSLGYLRKMIQKHSKRKQKRF